MNPCTPVRTLAAALALSAALVALPTALEGQARPSARAAGASLRVPSTPGLSAGGYVVVIDLERNRLFFTHGRRVLWSAPVGTGTGLRLSHGDDEWDFSTPDGVFHVQYKEEKPTWIAPDWYFVENDLPVPPAGSAKRRFPGGLGAAAVFIGEGLAIHGTDKPELLGERVSHGCIRLSNENALRLFHNVQVGTEVVIVGARRAAPAREASRPPRSSTRSAPAPAPDPFAERLEELSTDGLLEVLDEELEEEGRWPEVAGVLLRRGAGEDDLALRGLLLRVDEVEGAAGREYATFVADAFGRSPLGTLRELGRLDRAERRRAARTIVAATLALYPGSPDDRMAPWPTRRVPRDGLHGAAGRGWEALRDAEAAHRGRDGRHAAR